MPYETSSPIQNLQGDWRIAYKLPTIYSQKLNPPIIDTWVTVADVKGNLAIHSIEYTHDNDTHTSKYIDLEVTIDGVVYTNFDANDPTSVNHGFNSVATKNYIALFQIAFILNPIARYIVMQATDTINADQALSSLSGTCLAVLRCHQFKLRVRTRDVIGANAYIKCAVEITQE